MCLLQRVLPLHEQALSQQRVSYINVSLTTFGSISRLFNNSKTKSCKTVLWKLSCGPEK